MAQLHADVVVYDVNPLADNFRSGRWAELTLMDREPPIPQVLAVLKFKPQRADPTAEIREAIAMLLQFMDQAGPILIVPGSQRQVEPPPATATPTTERVVIPLDPVEDEE